MSTRANVKIISEEFGEKKVLWFYRHSDGYPEGTLPTLKKFMGAVKDGTIRDNIGQSAGWLILLGAEEYKVHADFTRVDYKGDRAKDWKVGAYEPTTSQHGDIEFLYTLDLNEKVIHVDHLDGTIETVTDFGSE